MTPSLSGRTATMLPGVRPIIRLASMPTATIWPLLVLRATTDGSLSTIPRPRTYTSVLAVPRSTAMSRPRTAIALLMGRATFPVGRCCAGQTLRAGQVDWRLDKYFGGHAALVAGSRGLPRLDRGSGLPRLDRVRRVQGRRS